MESKVVWKDGMALEAHLEGFTFTIDADEAFGGQGSGPKPKGLVLTSLAGCTAMDVISILNKMRVPFDHLEVAVDGHLTEDHPKRFDSMVVTYTVKGDSVPVAKLLRAVQLSEERYCGVSATLKPAVAIENVVILNGERVN